MENLPLQQIWHDRIYQIETKADVLRTFRQLGDRTLWLKNWIGDVGALVPAA
jgi:hypothetical protein